LGGGIDQDKIIGEDRAQFSGILCHIPMDKCGIECLEGVGVAGLPLRGDRGEQDKGGNKMIS
jgi:hypothetical protein